MKEKIKKYIKEVLLFALIMIVFANVISLYRSLDLNKQPLNISTINTLFDTKYTLPSEKPVLVHFWATWCPTCKAESGNIQNISENFEVITIAFKSGSDIDIHKYLKESDLDFKVINDKDGYLTSKFGISVFPTTIIYDKNRDVVFSDVGYTSTWGLWLRMWWAGLK